MTSGVPLNDADSGWKTLDGTVRVRVHPLGSVQLQVSVPRADGSNTFDVSTLLLAGSLRDTRNSPTPFFTPVAPGGVPVPWQTSGDRDASAALAAQSKVVTHGTGDGPPISASSAKH